MAYAADLCGSKLRAKLSSTLNEASAEKISSTSFAAKQMAKMGWTEGTGLGKKRDGIVSHIKVNKREENIGLGVEKERTRQMGVEGMWWSSSVADTLMKLQQKNKSNSSDSDKDKSKKKKDKKEKKSKKSSKQDKAVDGKSCKIYTEDELFEATGGARFGTKGGKRAIGKWKRSESSKELKDWEDQVKDKAEWNGLGKATIILSDSNSNNEKKSNKRKKIICEEVDEDIANFNEEKKETDKLQNEIIDTCSNSKSEKKTKKRKIVSEESDEINDSFNEEKKENEPQDKDGKAERKKRKSEKKSSKKKKKSNDNR